MKQIKNIKRNKTKAPIQKIPKFSLILIGKILYTFCRLTTNQKFYILKTMENLRKYKL